MVRLCAVLRLATSGLKTTVSLPTRTEGHPEGGWTKHSSEDTGQSQVADLTCPACPCKPSTAFGSWVARKCPETHRRTAPYVDTDPAQTKKPRLLSQGGVGRAQRESRRG